MYFEGLLKRISPKLKGIVYRLSRQSPLANYEDLYQESLIHLWREFSQGRISDKTDSYILQGCYFYLKNYLRLSSVNSRALSLEEMLDKKGCEADELLCLKCESHQDPRDSLNSKLFAETIRNDGLSKREKDILFFYAEGLTTREIGRRVSLSHVRVVKLLAQIKEKCRKYVDKI